MKNLWYVVILAIIFVTGCKSPGIQLYDAAGNGDIKRIESLLGEGVNVNVRCEEGITPLHNAAWNGKLEAVKFLILHGAEINARTYWGFTPLQYAVLSKDISTIKLLLSSGATVWDINLLGETAFTMSLDVGDTKIINLLLSNGVNVNQELCLSVEKGIRAIIDTNIQEMLLQHGADINYQDEDGNSPMHLAVKSFNLLQVKWLIKNNAQLNNINHSGYTPLDLALNRWGGDADKIKRILLQAGASPKTKYSSSDSKLYELISMGLLDVAILMMQKGAWENTNLGESRYSFLHLAASKKNSSDLMKLLIEKGININGKDADGRTPLHISLINNRIQNARFLISAGADINATDDSGKKPIDYTETPEIKALFNTPAIDSKN